jgi:transglutaminase-like putative cysteine protease
MRKSYCKTRRRRTNRFLLLAAVAGVLVVTPARLGADSAPDWLRAVAQDKLPEYPKDTVAVVLLDETQTTVKDNGEIEVRRRRAFKLLRPEAREDYGAVRVYFDNDTQISFLKTWTLMPEGKAMEVKEGDAVEASISSFEVFSDARVKILSFPEANPGSVVGYEVVQKTRPYLFDDVWEFQRVVPVQKAIFSLQLPRGWEFSAQWANHAEVKPESPNGNHFVWQVNDTPAIEVEPEMPPWRAVAGHMDVKYYPRDPALRAKTSGSWMDIGLWYAGVTASTREATPAIQQRVAELTTGMTDLQEKMKALAAYVQHQVRYAAIEIGIGGFQPHAAGEVFAHQYGDCKDKVTLLSSMLQEIGIQSYYVLIDTHRGAVSPNFPSLRFNHAILAIRLPENASTGNFYAVAQHPKYGRLLFFDPTDEYVPLGYLPAALQDNYGLVVTPAGGELLRLPLLPASTNRLLRTAKLELSPAGNLAGEVREIRWGGPAEQSREQFLSAPPGKRSKVLENFLGTFLNNFTLTGASVGNLEKFDESLTLDYKFVVEGYAKTAGNLLILHPRVVGEKGSSILTGKPRKYPIEFEEATRQDDLFDIALPAGYVVDELPQPVQVDCAYGTYKSEVQVTGNILHYKRTYEIKEVMVPTQKLDEVKNFLHQIATDERSSAVLRRAAP